MANPRKIVAPLDGVAFRALTFLADGSTIAFSETAPFGTLVAGRAVGLKSGSANTVELVAAGQDVLGRLDHVESDGVAVVQVEGECKLPQGNAVTVVVGDKITGALGPASARGYIGPIDTTSAATAASSRHTVLDITTTTAISVLLGKG
jgi:hypothetical protein